MSYLLTFPSPDASGGQQTLQVDGSVLIIGANGSGKSRLGKWLEDRQHGTRKAKRISAQKLLNFGEAQPQNLTQAKAGLDGQKVSVEQPANDFQQLLTLLFAQERKRDQDYTALGQKSNGGIMPVPPKSELQKIAEILKELFPKREFEFSEGKLNVMNRSKPYMGNEMSDGEKVAFYLLGHSLCSDKDLILIVDEPELHLHRSLMAHLWRKIQELRPDCNFIYITHDLDFAASITDVKKIWLKEFPEKDKWEWQELASEIEGIPESLALEILGNRRPVLFVESEKGKFDHLFYQELYPDFFVSPRGNFRKVIDSTKALRENPIFHHHLKIYGLIDRDFKKNEEIMALQGHGVKVLGVVELENLLCLPEVTSIIAVYKNLNAQEINQKIGQFIFAQLQKEKEVQVTRRTADEIRFGLTRFEVSHKKKNVLAAAIKVLQSVLDADFEKLYGKNEKEIDEVISENSVIKPDFRTTIKTGTF